MHQLASKTCSEPENLAFAPCSGSERRHFDSTAVAAKQLGHCWYFSTSPFYLLNSIIAAAWGFLDGSDSVDCFTY